MWLFTVALSALCSFDVSATQLSSRDTSLGQFWGYGKNISGQPLIFADGYAYLGNDPTNSSQSTNLTLSLSDSGTVAADAVDSTISDYTTTYLAIDTSDGAFSPVQLSSSPNASLTTSNFTIFGKLLVWTDSDGDLESQWWAEKVQTGVWLLKWNAGNAASEESVSVVLKPLAPRT